MTERESTGLVMSPGERARAAVLIVESDGMERNNMRVALKALGFGTISDAASHAAALEKLGDRPFTHIIFEAKRTNMPAREFLEKVFGGAENVVAIPSSYEPNVDDVFDLLIIGARGYLCKPFTIDSIDDAIVAATKGEPMSEAVLQAKDRNEALVAIMMSSLDKTATVLRQAQQFETARREVPRCMAQLKRSTGLARTFAKGGDDGLVDAIERFCVERSKGPATKLGRLRKRLKNGRGDDDEAGKE